MITFMEHPGRKVADIKIFALSTCPYCHATMDYLNENGIEYEYIFVDRAPEDEMDEVEEAIARYNPDETFPTIVIDGGAQIIIGFNQEKLAALIGAAHNG